ncbi:DUF1240 domain-containing protein [Pectobacterium versatile]|uniref:DUF1240 domain-containing protein n=1 Tax=Pectobacterium versatile TaxID=2488639 RepID=UPI00398C3AEA
METWCHNFSSSNSVSVFLFWFFFCYKKRPIKMNNKTSNLLVMFAIYGAAVRFFSSMYISYSLNKQGYKICSKNSWMAPNKYVRDVSLCD